jgi:hypothetical protein
VGDISKYIIEKNWKYTELSDQSGKEAKAYYLWFIEQIDKRIEYLRSFLVEDKVGFTLDYSEESLSDLWIWFRGCKEFARTKASSDKQKEDEVVKILKGIEMDVSIYFAETMIHNHPQLYWDYYKVGRRNFEYNQPVVRGFSKDSNFSLLPWRIIQVCSISEDRRGTDNNILAAYKVWENHIH